MDFAIGGLAGAGAGLFSNIFDVLKTRQQLQGELIKKGQLKVVPYKNVYQSMKSVVKAEGITGLQKGLSGQLAFQFVMNSIRLGIYQKIDESGWTRDENGKLSHGKCIILGGASGIVGVTFASPFYMIKCQLQAQSASKMYSVGYQHSHKGLVDALITTFKKGGIKGLWKGYSAIVPRNAVGSAVQLSTFSKCKDQLLKIEFFSNSVIYTAIFASCITGFITCVFMTPFDGVATRIFNQGVDANGKGLLYRNIFDCFYKTFKVEGIHGFYKGFYPNYLRMAPHHLLNLTFWEQFKKWKIEYENSPLK